MMTELTEKEARYLEFVESLYADERTEEIAWINELYAHRVEKQLPSPPQTFDDELFLTHQKNLREAIERHERLIDAMNQLYEVARRNDY